MNTQNAYKQHSANWSNLYLRQLDRHLPIFLVVDPRFTSTGPLSSSAYLPSRIPLHRPVPSAPQQTMAEGDVSDIELQLNGAPLQPPRMHTLDPPWTNGRRFSAEDDPDRYSDYYLYDESFYQSTLPALKPFIFATSRCTMLCAQNELARVGPANVHIHGTSTQQIRTTK